MWPINVFLPATFRGANFSPFRTLPAVMLFVFALVSCTEEDLSSVESGNVESGNAVSSASTGSPGNGTAGVAGSIALDVYKSPTCGCCVTWIEHMQEHGFETAVHHPQDMNQVKADLGVAPEYQSCHTAVTEESFVFEGHIPARYVERFMAEPPADAIGLAVPGMPLGSPGMEVDDRFTPYEVLLLKADGTSEVYVSIESKADQ